jgi:hypothetical protein
MLQLRGPVPRPHHLQEDEERHPDWPWGSQGRRGAIEHHRLRFSALDDVAFASEPDRDAYEAANAAEEEALEALCCTPPTTIAGTRAGIEYVMTVEDFQGVPAARAYLENLLASPLLFPGGSQA